MRSKTVKILALAILCSVFNVSHAGMPGMRGTQHIGFTVPNIDKAITWFEDVTGCESFFAIAPFGPFNDNWMTENLNVDNKAAIKLAYTMRCGNGTNFKIFEYTSPDQNKTYVKNSDNGGNHIAFYIDDMHDAVAYLKKHKVKILGEPHTFEDTGMEGLTWLTPWGQQLKTVSYPKG